MSQMSLGPKVENKPTKFPCAGPSAVSAMPVMAMPVMPQADSVYTLKLDTVSFALVLSKLAETRDDVRSLPTLSAGTHVQRTTHVLCIEHNRIVPFYASARRPRSLSM